jgi:hypothetical protein
MNQRQGGIRVNTFDSTFGYQSDGSITAEPDSRLPSWCAFLMGSVVAFLLVFVGVARPLMQEMGTIRRQLQLVQQNVTELTAYGEGVKESNHLLAMLKEQESLTRDAAATLDALQALKARLDIEAADISVVEQRLNELVALKNAVADAGERVSEAASVFTTAEVLHQRLANASDMLPSALESSHQLLALGERMAAEQTAVLDAQDSLNSLLQLQGNLNKDCVQLENATAQLHGLIQLKDTLIHQAPTLVDAIEALELAKDVQAQFETAARAFSQIRLWMLEVIASEGSLRQAQQALAPLAEITNLKRMNVQELRAMIQSWSEDGIARLAERHRAEGNTPSTAQITE